MSFGRKRNKGSNPSLLSLPISPVATLDPIAWFDASDTTSLRVGRDGSGGFPDVDDLVGLMLDKSQMGGKTADAFIAAQPELVTDGGFDLGVSEWTLYAPDGGSISHVGSALRLTSGTARSRAFGTITTVPGTYYRFKADVAIGTADLLRRAQFKAGTTAGNSDLIFVDGDLSGDDLFFRAATTTTHLTIQVEGGGFYMDFDNISVKEIPGAHAIAPADNQRPTLRSGSYLEFDGVDDVLEFDTGIDHVSSLFVAANLRSGTGYRALAQSRRQASYLNLLGGTWGGYNNADLPSSYSIGSTPRVLGQVSRSFDDVDLYTDGNAAENITNGTSYQSRTPSISTRTPSQVAAMDFYGLLYCDRELTLSEIQTVKTFLAQKAGVTL